MARALIRSRAALRAAPASMQFSLNKLCRRGERTLPRFSSMFPAQATSRAVPEDVAVDGDMTLGGLPPLNATSATAEGASALALDTPATAAEDSNEIATAFASLDAEAADVAEPDRALPPEFRCRYRQGKCSQPRTLKKNGSMHSYCEHLLSEKVAAVQELATSQKYTCINRLDEMHVSMYPKYRTVRQFSITQKVCLDLNSTRHALQAAWGLSAGFLSYQQCVASRFWLCFLGLLAVVVLRRSCRQLAR
jgi:hypothetical protein